MSSPASHPRSSRPYMVAVVLGTALSTLHPDCVAAQSPEAIQQTINDMGRYCTTCWRNARLPMDSWSDCTQEVFRRLLERIPSAEWNRALVSDGDEHREFLRAIDAVKKRTQRTRKFASAIDFVPDSHEFASRVLEEDREAVRLAAQDLLSPRQQRILQLSFEGWAAQDIARELGMPVERVSDEKYKAVRKLKTHLAEAEEGSGG